VHLAGEIEIDELGDRGIDERTVMAAVSEIGGLAAVEAQEPLRTPQDLVFVVFAEPSRPRSTG
jgi:hypothetical protein